MCTLGPPCCLRLPCRLRTPRHLAPAQLNLSATSVQMNLYESTSTISMSDNSNCRVLTVMGHIPGKRVNVLLFIRLGGDVLNGMVELGLTGELRQPGEL